MRLVALSQPRDLISTGPSSGRIGPASANHPASAIFPLSVASLDGAKFFFYLSCLINPLRDRDNKLSIPSTTTTDPGCPLLLTLTAVESPFLLIMMASNASPQPTCQNCRTSTTPLWRRDEYGAVLCNACGLFLKLHGRPRPISLKTDVIKSRNRVKTMRTDLAPKKKVRPVHAAVIRSSRHDPIRAR